MDYDKLLLVLLNWFRQVPGINAVYLGEPSAIVNAPELYTLVERGNLKEMIGSYDDKYIAVHRLCIDLQDPQEAERELLHYIISVVKMARLDPALGGNFPCEQARLTEYRTGFVSINGTIYRSVDFISQINIIV
jgi:hypothetical protein